VLERLRAPGLRGVPRELRKQQAILEREIAAWNDAKVDTH
jgi:hypothetical protein